LTRAEVRDRDFRHDFPVGLSTLSDLMSSNRVATPCDAVVTHGDRLVGPLVMPMSNAEMFVEEFNRTYRAIGLTVRITESGRTAVQPPQATDNTPLKV